MKKLFNRPDRKDNATLSLGKSKAVCGYEIKKMPLGAYLRALERLDGLPEDFLGRCFPGKSAQEILDGLTKLNEAMIAEAARAAFVTAPEYAVHFVAELTGIEAETLLSDENIGLIGFMEIIQAFIEVNGHKNSTYGQPRKCPASLVFTGFV